MVVATDTSALSDSMTTYRKDGQTLSKVFSSKRIFQISNTNSMLIDTSKDCPFFNFCTHRKSSNYCKVVYTRIYASMYIHID